MWGWDVSRTEPHAPFPNLEVSHPDGRREYYQPDDFRAAFPQMDERSVQWLLNREVVGSGIPGLNCVDVHLYTAEQCAKDAAGDLLAACEEIAEHGTDDWDARMKTVLAAIAKAKGGAA